MLKLPLAVLVSSALGLAQAPSPDASDRSALDLPAFEGEFGFQEAQHLLVRAGFGGTIAEVESLQARGLEGAVDWLVDYENHMGRRPAIPEGPVQRPSRAELRQMSQEERQAANQKARRLDARSMARLRSWWMERLLRSAAPLEEKMTLFWHGHFTSSYRDVRSAYAMALQNDLFREQATGNFGALLGQISRDPAMLVYLNNNQNRKNKPNENYARELLELFTLGEGNYTEADIQAAARAFTGWTMVPRTAIFTVARNQHDSGKKTFMGETGAWDGDDVLRIILKQDAASRHLADRLLRFFAVEEPTADEIEPLAHILQTSNYELKPALRTLFRSAWFFGDRVRGRKIKSPVQFAVGFLRTLGAAESSLDVMGEALANQCGSVGQSLFQPPNVKGWDGGADWVTSSNLLGRYNMTRAILGATTTQSVRNRLRRRLRAAAEPAAGDSMQATEPQGQPASRPQIAKPSPNSGATSKPTGNQVPEANAPAMPSPGEIAALSVSIRRMVEAADATTPESVLGVLEKAFLVLPLPDNRRGVLLEFLRGEDGTKPLQLSASAKESRRQAAARSRAAEVKLRECLHLLTTTPEFQIH